MEYEKAFNFFLFGYFGIEDGIKAIQDKSNKKAITMLCAYRAYLDLARTVKFKYSSTELNKLKKSKEQKNEAVLYEKAKKKLIEDICGTIIEPVNNTYCTEKEFSDWHRNKCLEIREKMNSAGYGECNGTGRVLTADNAFTIGHAQKWINMTLKYLWLLDILPDGLTQKTLHIPIDSYILSAMRSKDKKDYGLSPCEKLNSLIRSIAWSSWDNYQEYQECQEEAKGIIRKLYNTTPIEWEEKAWLEMAKKKRGS